MRILITGRVIPGRPGASTAEQSANAFRELGHDVIFYGNVYNTNNFIGYKELQDINKIDLWIYYEMMDGNPQFNMLRNYYKLKDVPVIYHNFDYSYYPEQCWNFASTFGFDGFLIANRLYVEKFNELKPSIFSPYAFSPHIHRRLPEIKKEHLYGFIGSMTPEREQLIKEIRQCGREVYTTQAFGEDLVKETNKIGVMLHRQQGGCKGLCPGRPLEVGGCGTALLIHVDDWPDIKPIYGDDYPLVYSDISDIFCTKGDLSGGYITNIWCSDIKSAEALGADLRNNLLERHTYRHRAESIINFARSEGLL